MLERTPGIAAAIREAGGLIRARLGSPGRVDLKGRANLASEVDLLVERLLRERLQPLVPEAGFLGEELGGEETAWMWVVDPLDGTTNFVHGYPHSAVSVALVHERRPVLGVVYDPARDELFWAEEGQGATRNGEAIAVSPVDDPRDSLLSTGPEPFAFWRHWEKRTLGVRRDGCASLDFCYVACGRTAAFCEHDLQPWDVAAGLLILQEAGGRTTDFQGAPAHPWSGDFLASNGRLHDVLLESLTR